MGGVTFAGHDRALRASRTASTRLGSTSMPRHHAIRRSRSRSRSSKQQGRRDAEQQLLAAVLRVDTGIALHRSALRTSLGSRRTATTDHVAGPSGKKLDYKNVGCPGSVVGARAKAFSGAARLAVRSRRRSRSASSPATGPAGGYLALNRLLGANLTIPGGDDADHERQRADLLLRRRAVHADRRRHRTATSWSAAVDRVRTSCFFPQTFPNARAAEQRARLFGPTPTPRAACPAAMRSRSTSSPTGTATDHRRLPGDQESSNSTTHTGEIWIRTSALNHIGPAGEQLTYSYGTANAAAGDPGSAINWGAENRDGTSGKNISPALANSTEYRPV